MPTPRKVICSLLTWHSMEARGGASVVLAMLFLTITMCSSAQERPADAAQLMREVVQNELQPQNEDDSHWQYREIREVDGTKELREVYQTNRGNVYRVLVINDSPLNAKQAAAEARRLRTLLSDPERMREKQEEQHADAEKERKLLDMLPNAFRYQYDGTDGHLIRLNFTANPEFHPTNRAGEVFHHLAGSVLIDRESKHLVEISGRLTDDVKFGIGLLGHVEKGGTFLVVQKDAGFGHWQLALIDVEMKGKAMLFKSISIRQRETYSNYRRLPDDVTLEQVASTLLDGTIEAQGVALE
jgi:hypothetical protein